MKTLFTTLFNLFFLYIYETNTKPPSKGILTVY